jgi:hypothetical protein
MRSQTLNLLSAATSGEREPQPKEYLRWLPIVAAFTGQLQTTSWLWQPFGYLW